jgi:hypothetical protein
MKSSIVKSPNCSFLKMNESERDIGQEILDAVLEIKDGGGRRFSVQVLPPEAVAQQRRDFEAFMQSLGSATDAQVEEFLAQREVVEPEPELQPEIVTKLRQKIAQQLA